MPPWVQVPDKKCKVKRKKVHAVSDIHLNPTKQLATGQSKLCQTPTNFQESGKESSREYNTITNKSDLHCQCRWYRRGKCTLGRYPVISDKIYKNGFDAKLPIYILSCLILKTKQNPLVATNYSPVFRCDREVWCIQMLGLLVHLPLPSRAVACDLHHIVSLATLALIPWQNTKLLGLILVI